MLNCDGNENSKKKKQQQLHLWLANLCFRLIGHGGGGGGGEYSAKCYTGRLRPDRPIYYYLV